MDAVTAPSGPRFFLAPGGRPEQGEFQLAPGEAEHALRVLRLRAGDQLVGLDGRGTAWPLAVRSVERGGRDRGALVLASRGPAWRDREPGSPGASQPWIEACVAWPRPNRAQEMLDRLTQLGVSSIVPLLCAEGGAAARARSIGRPERLQRALCEAVKQCRRTWLPEIAAPLEPSELASRIAAQTGGTRAALLDWTAGTSLWRWLTELPEPPCAWGSRAHPLRLIIGPEGGFAGAEREQLLAAGAAPCALGPHVLRIESAADLAVGIAASLAAAAAQSQSHVPRIAAVPSDPASARTDR